jgi:hypothetical protein
MKQRSAKISRKFHSVRAVRGELELGKLGAIWSSWFDAMGECYESVPPKPW